MRKALYAQVLVFLFAFSFLCASGGKTHLLLIRHGETDWNVEDLYLGRTNVSLNFRGLEQAEKLAEYLAQAHPDIKAIYSSDLDRAYSTAWDTASKFNLPVTRKSNLREIDWGVAEGYPTKETDELYSRNYLENEKKENWNQPVFPEAETFNELLARVHEELNLISAEHPGEKVAIFTHGRVLRTLITHSLNYSGAFSKPPNCAIAHFIFDPESKECPFKFLEIETPLQ